MQQTRIGASRLVVVAALVALTLAAAIPATLRAQAKIPATHGFTWSKDLEGWAQRASVAFANVDGDSDLEIFAGTNAGKVYGYNPDGSALPGWPVNVVGTVTSAPAIGDITGDGVAEVVITTGGLANTGDTTGSIRAYSAGGAQLWQKLPMLTSSTKKPGGVFGAPVLADLNGDKVLDVVVASYDQNVYALKGSDGTPLFPSTPLTAKNIDRNGALIWLGDSTWATPAVGDVDGDGAADIVVTSATNIDARFSYIYPGWSDQATVDACSKTPQSATGTLDRSQKRACGLVAVFSNTGALKPGWPKFIAGHTYDASPVLANLDDDAQLEIVTGNGWDPAYGVPSLPFHITIWNHDGSISKRSVNIDAATFESGPVLGDITGDSRPEIVIGTNPFAPSLVKGNQNKIFAFDTNLNILPGFPVESRDGQFETLASPGVPSLADVSGDGKADIIFGTTWDVRAINGSGQYLNSNLVIHGTGPFSGQPAVGNIDGDANLELVYVSGKATQAGIIGALHKLDLGVSAGPLALPWAQFHGGPLHTGLFAPPELRAPASIGGITDGTDVAMALEISDSLGGGLAWSASTGQSWIKLGKTSGTTGADKLPITLDASTAPFSGGVAEGTITVTSGSLSKTISVRFVEVDQIRSTVYLPVVRR